jgi:hypothetical protein
LRRSIPTNNPRNRYTWLGLALALVAFAVIGYGIASSEETDVIDEVNTVTPLPGTPTP